MTMRLHGSALPQMLAATVSVMQSFACCTTDAGRSS
jgi:hypothetical protein